MMKRDEYAFFGLELAHLELHAKGGRRTMVGYASAFDFPIPTDDRAGHAQTSYFRQGAWNKTLKENGAQVQVLFDHGMDPQIGRKPLGVPAVMRPDATGLWTETPLDRTSYNDDILIPLLESGALRSMSVQFAVMQDSYNGDRTERYIEQAMLREFGPTPFPRNLGATAALHSLWPGDGQAQGDVGTSQGSQAGASPQGARTTWEQEQRDRLSASDADQARIAERMKALKGG